MARASQEASQKPILLWACFCVVLWWAFAATSKWWPWCHPNKGVLNQVNKDSCCVALARPSQEANQKPILLWVCFCVVLWCALAASSNWWLWCHPKKGVLNQVNKDSFCVAIARACQEASQNTLWLWACFFVVLLCAFAASSNWWLWCHPKKGVLNHVNKDSFCVAMARAIQEASQKPVWHWARC